MLSAHRLIGDDEVSRSQSGEKRSARGKRGAGHDSNPRAFRHFRIAEVSAPSFHFRRKGAMRANLTEVFQLT